MSDQDKDGLIAQLKSITGVGDTERATLLLEAVNWNLNLAISGFFDEPPLVVHYPLQSVNLPSQDTEESVGAGGNDERSKPATIGRGKIFFPSMVGEGS